MAERFPEPAAVVMDPVEVAINSRFDELVHTVNRRRVELLLEHRERRDEMRARETGLIRTKQQLLQAKEQLHDKMEENTLHSLREKMTEDIETKLRDLEVTDRPMELSFQCETREVEETISQLGRLIQKQILSTPNYPQPRISVCEEGKGPGQLNWPRGIAYDETSHLIYVVDSNGIWSSRVCVFSEEGEYIHSFGEGELNIPVGVAISGENIYVSACLMCTFFRYKLPDYRLVSRVGEEGSGKNEFSDPQRISVSSNGDVYVADLFNNRVVVMDCKLRFKHSIQHSAMTYPCDVRTLNDEVYVLSLQDNPCFHVFHKSGRKLRSFITRGKGSEYQVEEGCCFCLDKLNNILIGDYMAKRIKVFSPAGILLHTLGGSQDEDKQIKPRGIIVTSNNNIICSSESTNFRLHIFY